MAFAGINFRFTADLSNLSANLAAAQGKLEKFTKENSAGLRTVGVAAAALGTAITGATTLAIKSFGEFESALAGVRQQLAGGREQELAGFEKGLRDLSAASGQSLPILTKGLEDVINAGIDAGNELNALNDINKLAITTNTDLGSAIDSVRIVTQGFGAEAGSVANITDKLFETARAGTVSMDELRTIFARLGTVAASAGVKFEDFGGAVAFFTSQGVNSRTIQSSLVEVLESVTNQTEEQTRILAQNGIEINRTTLAQDGLLGTLQKLGQLRDEDLSKIVTEVKSREAIRLTVQRETEALRLFGQVKTAQGVVDEDFRKRQEDLNQQLRELGATFNALMVEAVQPLIPIIKEAVQAMKGAVQQVREFAQANPELASTITVIVAALGPLLIAFGGFLVILPNLVAGFKLLLPIFAALTAPISIAGVAIGVLTAALIALAASLSGKVIQHVLETQKAIKLLGETSAATGEQMTTHAERVRELVNSLDDLTQAEKEHAIIAAVRVQRAREQIQEAVKQGAAFKGNFQALIAEQKASTDALLIIEKDLEARKKRKDALNEETEARGKATEASQKAKVALSEEAAALAVQEERIRPVLQAIRDLGFEYANGKVRQDEFRLKLAELTQDLAASLGSFDKAAERIKTLFRDEDFRVKISVDSPNEQELREIKERILSIVEDIQIAQATGAQRQELERARQARLDAQANQESLDRAKKRLLEIEQNLVTETALKERALLQDTTLTTQARSEQLDEFKRLKSEELTFQKKVVADIEAALKQLSVVQKQQRDQAIEGARQEVSARGEVVQAVERQIQAARTLISTEAGREVRGGGTTTTFVSREATQQPAPVTNIFVNETQTQGRLASILSSPFRPGQIQRLQTGSAFVRSEGIFHLERGEQVLRPDENPFGVGAASREERGTTTIINLIDPEMVPALLARFPNAILNTVNADILNNGITRRVVRSARR